MPFQTHFRRELQRRFDARSSAHLQSDIEARYRAIHPDVAFARTSSNPIDRRLEFCAYFLATIQALEARGQSFEEIKQICVAVTESYVRPRNPLHHCLKRLPARLMGTWIMRLTARIMAAKTGAKGHPDGFLARIITDPAQTNGLGYGVDILECGICKLFTRHNASQYVPILCEVDRLTSSLAGLELIRQGTIATGAGKCDFRFNRR